MPSFNSCLAEAPYPIVGLTGGIASGKTHVANILASHGWTIIDADHIAREVVKPGTDALDWLVKHFGSDILQLNGHLDRVKLANLVFSDPNRRSLLETFLYPHIEASIAVKLSTLSRETRGVIIDAALWVELGVSHAFDSLWIVNAPKKVRIERLMRRDHLTEKAAIERILSQVSDAERNLHADQIFDNTGTDLTKVIMAAEKNILDKWKIYRSKKWNPQIIPPFTSEQMRSILEILLSSGGNYAEVFIEKRKICGLGMDNGKMEDISAREIFGVSLQLANEGAIRFADLIAPSIDELLAAAQILTASSKGSPTQVPSLVNQILPNPSPIGIEPSLVPLSEKIDLLRNADSIARNRVESTEPGKLRQVTLGYGDSIQSVWIAAADCRNLVNCKATLTEDRRVQSVFRINVTVGEGDNLQTGYQALNETSGFELFTQEAIEKTTIEAVRLATQALTAHPAPAGTFPVIISSSAGGTIIHEACGHGLEADLALAGVSAFSGKIGERVASEVVSIIDDGTLQHKSGSSSVDDEGQPTQRVVLIEHGILKSYLQSRKTAWQMNIEPTGNGRRESYRNIPIPRMRNTFLAPGQENPDDILKDLDQGLLVKHMGGGQVDTVTGNFVFQVTEGYWVERGTIMYPVKNATLTGCGPELLMNISRIGTDLCHFDVGTCGKDGQGVPVSDAMPTILCPALIIGGTA
jgi:TldD protein